VCYANVDVCLCILCMGGLRFLLFHKYLLSFHLSYRRYLLSFSHPHTHPHIFSLSASSLRCLTTSYRKQSDELYFVGMRKSVLRYLGLWLRSRFEDWTPEMLSELDLFLQSATLPTEGELKDSVRYVRRLLDRKLEQGTYVNMFGSGKYVCVCVCVCVNSHVLFTWLLVYVFACCSGVCIILFF
jgi:hypothetical protein